MILAIFVDPFEAEVVERKMPNPTSAAWLTLVYDMLSHETMPVRGIDSAGLGTERAHPGIKNFLLVDEHGLVRDDLPRRWFRLHGMHPQAFAGRGLIIGADRSGTERSTTFDVAEIEWRTRFFERIGNRLIPTVTPWSGT